MFKKKREWESERTGVCKDVSRHMQVETSAVTTPQQSSKEEVSGRYRKKNKLLQLNQKRQRGD